MTIDSGLLQAMILGAVQGVTEFLPISSDGHLVIVRELFGWSDQGLFFDITIHMATLLAVIIYFWKDWANILAAWRKPNKNTQANIATRRLSLYILYGTLPVVPAALVMLPAISNSARDLSVVAYLMILSGLIFWWVAKTSRPRRNLSRLTIFDAIGIGLAQAAAILPGISRSGSTIAAALYQGIKTEDAARFSFLLAVPAIAGAGVFAAIQILTHPGPSYHLPTLAIAFGCAFVFGLASIHLLLYLLRRIGLTPFAYYLVVVGGILLALNYWHVQFSWLG